MVDHALNTITGALMHPGHGAGDGFGVIHYLTEPIHALWIGIGLVGVVVLLVLRRRGRLGEARTPR